MSGVADSEMPRIATSTALTENRNRHLSLGVLRGLGWLLLAIDTSPLTELAVHSDDRVDYAGVFLAKELSSARARPCNSPKARCVKPLLTSIVAPS